MGLSPHSASERKPQGSWQECCHAFESLGTWALSPSDPKVYKKGQVNKASPKNLVTVLNKLCHLLLFPAASNYNKPEFIHTKMKIVKSGLKKHTCEGGLATLELNLEFRLFFYLQILMSTKCTQGISCFF